MHYSLLMSVALMITNTINVNSDVAWNAPQDVTSGPTHQWSYACLSSPSWDGKWKLDSPDAETANVTPEGVRLFTGRDPKPALGLLIWTAPEGGYYDISGEASLLSGDKARLFAICSRRSQSILEVQAEKADKPRAFRRLLLLNRGDKIACGAEPVGNGDTVESLWKVSIKRLPTVPQPWTPIEVKDRSLTCWNRVYSFTDGLLPSGITSGEKQLFSSPIQLVAKADGKEVKWDSATFFVEQASADVVCCTTSAKSGKLQATCKYRFEFDGFLLCDLTVQPVSDLLKVDSLELRIPFDKNAAKLFHHQPIKPIAEQKWATDTLNCGAIPKQGMNLPFVHHIWIGDEKRGLQWFAESDQGLSSGDNFLNIDTSKVMTIHLLRETAISTSEPFRLTFGFMASPVKPMVQAEDIRWCFGWQPLKIWNHNYNGTPCDPDNSQLASLRDMGVNCFDLYNVDWKQGDPYPDNPEIQNLVTAANRFGLAPMTAAGIWADEKSEGYVRDWVFAPEMSWSHPDIPGRVLRLMCQRGDWRQWFLDRVDRAFTEAGVRGIYIDGSGTPQKCQNTAHGCGYKDQTGNTHYTLPILPTRELMKQQYMIARSVGKQTYIVVHTSSTINLPCLSFADAYLEGEHINRYPEDGRYTLEGFRAQMMGHPYGIPAFYLKYPSDPKDETRCSAYALLHGLMPVSLAHAPGAWKALGEFGTADAKWYPYWEDSGPVTADAPFRVSTYTKPGKGLLAVVTNFTQVRTTGKLHITHAKKMKAKDLTAKTDLAIKDGAISIALEPGGYALISISE